MNRRRFMTYVIRGGALFFLKPSFRGFSENNNLENNKEEKESAEKFKFWGRLNGFNLQNFYMVHSIHSVDESEIKLLKELGFNFVRFPMDYRCWTGEKGLYEIREDTLKEIDKAIDVCIRYGIHVCLNFHRAPGWTVAQPPESLSLWKDTEAVNACAYHWKLFAERYKHISHRSLSYNLFNEPPAISADVHKRVVGKVIEEIRKIDDKKYILCDGRMWGFVPPLELADFDIVASFHMYHPFTLTHYKAEWVGKWDEVPVPTYPLEEKGVVWNKDSIEQKHISPWKNLEEKGVPVFVGEFGAYNKTPHKIVLKWMEDCLEIFKKNNWGWALWNFKGPFGPLNSGRADVVYEKEGEVLVDKEMLTLLKRFVSVQ